MPRGGTYWGERNQPREALIERRRKERKGRRRAVEEEGGENQKGPGKEIAIPRRAGWSGLIGRVAGKSFLARAP